MGTPPPIELANLGMADSLILMVMALVVFGPRRLPQIGRQIGKLMYEFRKASNDFKFQMEEELRLAEEADRRKKEEAERQRSAVANPALPGPPEPVSAPPPATAQSTQAQTIEAQADIGAGEPPAISQSESASAGTTPSTQPEANTPVIQPPSTGEPVAAAHPIPPNRHYNPEINGSGTASAETTSQAAAPEATASEATASGQSSSSSSSSSQASPTEPVSQHG